MNLWGCKEAHLVKGHGINGEDKACLNLMQLTNY